MINPYSLLHVVAQRVRVMAQHQRKAWLIVAGGVLCSTTPVLGEVYISTLDAEVNPNLRLGVSNNNWRSISFTTDNQAYLLNSVSISVVVAADTSGWEPFLTYLYTASSTGLPLSTIPTAAFTLSTALLPGSEQVLTFTANSPILLNASSHYAFAIGGTEETIQIGLHFTDSANGTTTEVPGSLWNIHTTLHASADQGATWVDLGAGSNAYRMTGSVNATAVPEPSSFALIGLAGAVGFYLRRRRTA